MVDICGGYFRWYSAERSPVNIEQSCLVKMQWRVSWVILPVGHCNMAGFLVQRVRTNSRDKQHRLRIKCLYY